MARRFEYMVCYAQHNRITFVNEVWQGTARMEQEGSLETCPVVSEFLQRAGGEAWELVAVVAQIVEGVIQHGLYLKRER